MAEELLAVFLLFLATTYAHDVHLLHADKICANVTSGHNILLPSPLDCNIYYKCENGMAIPQNCPDGLHWCEALTTCLLPAIANCTIGHIPVTYPPGHEPTLPSLPTPEEETCPEDGVSYPDAGNCGGFYICENHRPVQRNCSGNSVFSVLIGLCVETEVAVCIDELKPNDSCPVNGITFKNPVDCNSYYECVNNSIKLQKCGRNLKYNLWFRLCAPDDIAYCINYTTPKPTTIETIIKGPNATQNLCPGDGFMLPNYQDCHSFWLCTGDTFVSRSCPEGFYYSCWNQECLPSSIAQCEPETGKTCNQNGKKLPNPQDCRSYYECINGVEELEKCENGYEFNAWFSECVETDLAHCMLVTTSTTAHTTPITTLPPSPIVNRCPYDGAKLPDLNDCNSYYVCVNNQAQLQKCPDNTTYSCWDQTCLPPPSGVCITDPNQVGQVCSTDNSKLPYTENCSSYYECVNGTVEEKHCDSGLEYNKWYEKCLAPELAYCEHITTTTNTNPSEPTTTTEHPTAPTNTGTTTSTTEPTSTPTSETPGPTTSEHTTITLAPCKVNPSLSPNLLCEGNSINYTYPGICDCHTYLICDCNKQLQNVTCDPPEFNYNCETKKCENITHCCATGCTTTSTTDYTTTSSSTTSSNPSLPKTCPLGSDEAKLPNPNDCKTYFTCVNGEIVVSPCPAGEEYSCWDQRCESPQDSSCINNPNQEGQNCSMAGQLLPNVANCTGYYECDNGKIQAKLCASGKMYDPWLRICVEFNAADCLTFPTVSPTTGSTFPATPQENYNTCPFEGALFPNLQDCNSYYECINGTPETQNCLGGYIYSCWDQQCTSSNNGTCVNQPAQNGHKCPIDGVQVSGDDCTSYYECENGTIVLHKCPDGEEFNAAYLNCYPTKFAHCQKNTPLPTTPYPPTTVTPQPDKDVCPIDGALLPNILNCSTYFKCVDGKPTLELCVPGYAYSCWDQFCEPDSTARCILDTSSETNSTCKYNGQKTQNPRDCHSYYECVNHVVKLITCPSNTAYNKWFGICLSKDRAHCTTTNLTLQTTTTGATTPTLSTSNDICPYNGGVLPYPSDCTKYYVCENYKPVLKSCPSGQEYSCWDLSCKPSSNAQCINNVQAGMSCAEAAAHLPDIENCESYYECNNGIVEHKYCPLGLSYNKWFHECVDIPYAHCTVQTTTPTLSTDHTTTPSSTPTSNPSLPKTCPLGSDEAKLPNPNDCKTYFTCVNGEIVVSPCPAGEEYSCWNQRCESPQDSSCINSPNQEGQNCSMAGQLLPNVANCTGYYECVNGKIQAKICASGKMYDPWLRICVEFNAADCLTFPTVSPTTGSTFPPNPQENYNTCPFEGALFPNLQDCNSYYECINGTPEIQNCLGGYIYSCWDQQCTSSNNGTCVNQPAQNGHKCPIDGVQVSGDDCTSYYECENGTIVLHKCPDGEEFNAAYLNCYPTKFAHCQKNTPLPTTPYPPTTVTPQPDKDVCPIDGALLPNILNCSTYFKCVDGKPTLELCVPGYAYSCWEQFCEPDSTARCILDTSSETNSTCKYNGQKTQNPRDCHSYYQCVNHVVKLITCPSNTSYNKWFGTCVSEDRAHCTTTTVTLPSTTSAGTTPTLSTSNDICPYNGGVLPYPSDCTKYYVCENYKPVLKSCPSGQEYSCWDLSCKPSSNAQCINNVQAGMSCAEAAAHLPDIENCESYYECNNGIVEHKYCPLGLSYNKWFHECVDIPYAHCTVQTTTPTLSTDHTTTPSSTPTSNPSLPKTCPLGSDEAKLPNPNDCKTYFTCVNGEIVVSPCPAGEEYSCWDQRCESPQDSSCINSPNQEGQNCSMAGQLLPNVANCTGYYECDNGKIQAKLCASGKMYDPWLRICVEFNAADCLTFPTVSPTTGSTFPATPQENYNTCPFEGALFPNLQDCNSYYECINGTPETQNCLGGYIYSCWDQQCTSSNNGTCVNQPAQNGHKCPIDGVQVSGDDCTSYYECENGTIVLHKCPDGEEFNAAYLNCYPTKFAHCQKNTPLPTTPYPPTTVTPQPDKDVCPIDGALLPNILNCSTYFKCVDGKPTLELCVPGYAYSCWDQFCEPDSTARCILDTSSETNSTCKYNGQKTQNPRDCHSYYQCVNHVVKLITCPSNTAYNKWFGICLSKDRAHCTTTTVTLPSTTTGPTTPTLSTSNDICPYNGGVLPYPSDCTKYYVCENYKPVLKSCPSGQEYSCWDLSCKPSSNAKCINNVQAGMSCAKAATHLPDIENCESYYECNNGIVEHKYCPLGLSYNKWFHECVDIPYAHCSVQTTTPTLSTDHTTTPSSTTTSQHTSPCIVNPSLSPNLLCEGNSINYTYPGICDCHTYLICDCNKQLQNVTCDPPEFNYNCETKKCENITHCCATGCTTTSTTDYTTTSSSTTSSIPSLPKTCPLGSDEAKLPNPNDCKTYFTCVNGEIVVSPCPAGEEYSCWDQRCESPQDSSCINNPNQEGQNCSMAGQLLPNVANCTGYYECVNGKIQAKLCASGKMYDPWLQICVEFSATDCLTFPTVPVPPINGSIFPPNPQENYNTCPFEGALFPNLQDCNSYYECINGTPEIQNCLGGYIYSCWDQQCTPSNNGTCVNQPAQQGDKCSIDGVKVSGDDCTSYYECKNGIIVLHKCPDGEEFNAAYLNCYPTNLAHCQKNTPLPPTPYPPTTVTPQPNKDLCPIDGVLLPNPLNCSTYFKCVNETPTLELCVPGYAYSCWDQYCEPDSTARCILDTSNQTNSTCKYNGQKTQNPRDCHSYYQCVNHVVKLITCPSNTSYNKWFGTCVSEDRAHCTTTTVTLPSTTTGPTTPTLSTSNDICPYNGGVLPYPSDCTKYYVCENYKPVLKSCPSGQEYSCWDLSCKPSSNAQCINNVQAGMNCAKAATHLPDIENCESYYECNNGIVEHKYCPLGLSYNKWFHECVDIPYAHCTVQTTKTTPSTTTARSTPSKTYDLCPIEDAIFPDPVDCTKYYLCHNHTLDIHSCPDGQVYSCWDQKCESFEEAVCINGEDSQVGENCSVEGLRFSDVQNCSNYYECDNGTVSQKYCPPGLEFNYKFQDCYEPDEAYCQVYPIIPKPSPSTSPSNTPNIYSDICPMEGVMLPNPQNCSTFYKCINGIPTLQQCADGLQYSCWDLQCETPENANCISEPTGPTCSRNGDKNPDPTNCHRYLECVNGYVQVKTCENNEYYNQWFKSCVISKELAHCGESAPVIPKNVTNTTIKPTTVDDCPKNGAHIADPTDCTQYYECVKNKATIKKCPKGQLYSYLDEACKKSSEALCINVGSPVGLKCKHEGLKVQNLQSCTSYYECLDGVVEPQYCLPLFQYNRWYHSCELVLFAHCQTYPTIAPSTTPAPLVTTIKYPFISCTGKGQIPDIHDCNKYSVCAKKSVIQYNCPPGSNYDGFSQSCIASASAKCGGVIGNYEGQSCPKNGVTLPNPNECGSYYKCKGKKIMKENCPFLKQYDIWTHSCRISLVAKCILYLLPK